MPKQVKDALSAVTVRQIKTPGRYADGNGLYLVVTDTGARMWQWRGTVRGRRCELGMGSVSFLSAEGGEGHRAASGAASRTRAVIRRSIATGRRASA